MNRMRILFTVLGVLLAALFISSCGGSQVPTEKSEVPRVTVEELKERIDNGEAIVIGDTRSQAEFDRRHVPGAILATRSQVESHLDQIPLDQEIILYCT